MLNDSADILIRIGAWQEAIGAYPVEATLDDGSFFYGGQLRLDRQELLTVQLNPEQYGLHLFNALFAGPIQRAYARASGRAESQAKGRLRVRLWIDHNAAELHAIPWERIYHQYRQQAVPLATSTLTPFSRYTGLEIAESEPIVDRPIHIGVAIANPPDLPAGLFPVEVEQEALKLYEGLGNLCRAGDLRVTLLPGRTGLSTDLRTRLEGDGYEIYEGPTTLDSILRLLSGCQVFHFVGHGFFRRRNERGAGEAALYLEREDGQGWRVIKDSDLVARLANMEPLPHLVFLSACETASRAEDHHPFIGLAPKLIQAGVPAVVAMQDLVPMQVARQLAGDFYRYLLDEGVIDSALNRARFYLFEQRSVDWAIPVLFMRLDHGRLFTANPVRAALQAMRARQENQFFASGGDYLPLPVEVLHLTGQQDPGSIERVGNENISSLDLMQAVLDIFARRYDQKATDGKLPPQLIALIGGPGTSRSTQLRRVSWITLNTSLRHNAGRLVIPVHLDLCDLPPTRTSPNAIESLLLAALQPFWPRLTAETLSELLGSKDGPILRVLFDSSDNVPDHRRGQVWSAVRAFVRAYPRHEYLLTTDPANYQPRNLQATDLLVIQPLSPRKIKHFLEALDEDLGPRLLQALNRSQMFDLAAVPWLLVRMVTRARAGDFSTSRTAVLQSLVEDAIVEIPITRGMRSRAERTLEALAWNMQSSRRNIIPISDALDTMAMMRGNREYALEDLFDELVKSGLLTRVGQESMRFTYPPIQNYCCARAILEMEGREQVLDDITATLGRLGRLRWWEDVLIFLSGLMRNPRVLLRLVVHGINMLESEQIFLAARCLLEIQRQRVDSDLAAQIVDALMWRINSNNEPSWARRIRAINALGQLWEPSTVPSLVCIANYKVRLDRSGQADYEASRVRMAASIALQRMMPQVETEVAAVDPLLAKILRLWHERDVLALEECLHGEDAEAPILAAFALGDIQSAVAEECLIKAFLDPQIGDDTRWAVTDALALLDPILVTNRAILPFLDEEAAARTGLATTAWQYRREWYEHLVYLIGEIRFQDPRTRAFLDHGLYLLPDPWLKGKVIQTLGWLYDRSYKELFEAIATGDYSQVSLPEELTAEQDTYLRRKAIEALGKVGDLDTLSRLRSGRADWTLELERAFYQASEEIHWRLNVGS